MTSLCNEDLNYKAIGFFDCIALSSLMLSNWFLLSQKPLLHYNNAHSLPTFNSRLFSKNNGQKHSNFLFKIVSKTVNNLSFANSSKKLLRSYELNNEGRLEQI